MALRKADETEYEEKTEYDKLELYEYVHDQNIKAWRVMLVWLCVNAIWGILYVFQVFDNGPGCAASQPHSTSRPSVGGLLLEQGLEHLRKGKR